MDLISAILLVKHLLSIQKKREAISLCEQLYRTHSANTEFLKLAYKTNYLCGKKESSLKFLKEILDKNPRDQEALFNIGVVYREVGDLIESKVHLLRYVEAFPIDLQGWLNLAELQLNLKDYESAIKTSDHLLSLDTKNSQAHLNKAIALSALKLYREALVSNECALDLNSQSAEAWNNYSATLITLGRLTEALAACEKAIGLRNTYSEAWGNQSLILLRLKDYKRSLISSTRAITLNPNFFEGWINHGNSQLALRLYQEALNSYDRAIELNKQSSIAWMNRGNALSGLYCFHDAVKSYQQAILLNSEDPEAWSNLGTAFGELRCHDDAVLCYKKSISIKPNFATAYWNLSNLLIRLGDFERGFKLYEWRWKRENSSIPARKFNEPLWLGDRDINGKRVLIYSEMGLGDIIQYCRYLKKLKDRGAHVIFEIPKPLFRLLENLQGVDIFLETGKNPPDFDFQCPLMSLPLAFRTIITNIPYEFGYIRSPSEQLTHWRDYIGSDKFKIAICWQGNPTAEIDIGRSFPVALFETISSIPGVRLISLQKNAGSDQLDHLPNGMKVEVLPDYFDNRGDAFVDSAAILSCVDLAITSDTALTHLSGALGVPTWLALQYSPDPRWLLDRHDTPWYPNHRLFRQEKPGDWISVFERMAVELRLKMSNTN